MIGGGDKGASALGLARLCKGIAEDEDHKCVLMVSKSSRNSGEAGISVFSIKGRSCDQRSIHHRLAQAAITQSTANSDGGCGYERVMKRRFADEGAIMEHSSFIWTTRHGDGSFGFQWRRNPSRKISVIGLMSRCLTLDAIPCRAGVI